MIRYIFISSSSKQVPHGIVQRKTHCVGEVLRVRVLTSQMEFKLTKYKKVYCKGIKVILQPRPDRCYITSSLVIIFNS